MRELPREEAKPIEPEAANQAAKEVIKSSNSHNDFFDALRAKGVHISDEAGFNNFAARISGPQGYALHSFLGLMQMFDKESPDPATLTTKAVHDKMATLLTREAEETLMQKGIPGEVLSEARREFAIRLLAENLARQGDRPEYCKVGDPRLKEKYFAKDPSAQQFLFECAKALLLQGKLFYEDIYR